MIKDIRRKSHILLNSASSDKNKNVLRFVYSRYADDWIIIGNFPNILAIEIRTHLKLWLKII